MMSSRPQYSDLSRMYTHKLVAERGIDTIGKCLVGRIPLDEEDRKVLESVSRLIQQALEGEKVIEGSHLTPASVNAGVALGEIIRLTQTKQSLDDFVAYLKNIDATIKSFLRGDIPSKSRIRELDGFLRIIERNAGQHIQTLKKGQMISVA